MCVHTLLSVPQQCMQCMLGAHGIIIVSRSLSFANCIPKTVSTVKLRLACYIGSCFSSGICRTNYTRYGRCNACLMCVPELPGFGWLRSSGLLASCNRPEECSLRPLRGGSLKSQLAYFCLCLDAFRCFSNISVLWPLNVEVRGFFHVLLRVDRNTGKKTL